MSTATPKSHAGLVPSRQWIWQAAVGCVMLAVAAIWCVKLALSADGPTLTLDVGNGARLELVRIPVGQFTMGSPDSEAGRDTGGSESPQHLVHINHAFYIGKFEVTQAQWTAVMANQSEFKGDMNLPADCVGWADAQKWCAVVSKRTGRVVRLPTEAEWEYACRAGTATPFSVGAALSSDQANFDGGHSYGGAAAGVFRHKTVTVGSFPPNAFGLYDMHGNVWEWCQDVFHATYQGAPTDGAAWMQGGDDPHLHVYRGGAWDNYGENLRSALRYANNDDQRNNGLGFRVVVEARQP